MAAQSKQKQEQRDRHVDEGDHRVPNEETGRIWDNAAEDAGSDRLLYSYTFLNECRYEVLESKSGRMAIWPKIINTLTRIRERCGYTANKMRQPCLWGNKSRLSRQGRPAFSIIKYLEEIGGTNERTACRTRAHVREYTGS